MQSEFYLLNSELWFRNCQIFENKSGFFFLYSLLRYKYNINIYVQTWHTLYRKNFLLYFIDEIVIELKNCTKYDVNQAM